MSNFSEDEGRKVLRRAFIQKASLLAGVCLLDCDAFAGQADRSKMVRTLDDDEVIHGKVNFQSGHDRIDAYLSRPKKEGRFPIVLVVAGNTFDEEYIQDMTVKLAQAGLIGVSPNILSLQKDSMTAEEKRRVFAEEITDDRIFQDLHATISYVKTQRFAGKRKIGITGFCFGGRCALMFAARSKDIGAVVPFYGNLRTPPFANRKEDPLDVLSKIKAPVQGHYAQNDAEIPPDQLRTFEETLKKQGTGVEVFTYNAPHGFFAYNRKSYNDEAAKLSWQRASEFLKKTLNH
jgi:carboxymethylenebutenolidase